MDPDQKDKQEEENYRDYGGEEFEVKRNKPKQKNQEPEKKMPP